MRRWEGDNGQAYYDCETSQGHEHETPSEANLCAMAWVPPRPDVSADHPLLTPMGPRVLLSTCGKGVLIDLCWRLLEVCEGPAALEGHELQAIGEPLVAVLGARRRKLEGRKKLDE